MYYDLNIAWPVSIPQAGSSNNNAASKKKQQKGKQAVNSNNDARDAAPKVGIDLLSAEERADVEKSVKMAIKRELPRRCPLHKTMSNTDIFRHFFACIQSATLQ